MWLPQDTGSQKQYVDEERCDEGVIYGRKFCAGLSVALSESMYALEIRGWRGGEEMH